MSLLSWLRSRNYPEDLYLNPHQVCREEQAGPVTPHTPALPATLHRPDAAELLLPTRPGGVCQTENCDAAAVFIVSRHLRGRTVCRGCMENMTAFGWTLEGRL